MRKYVCLFVSIITIIYSITYMSFGNIFNNSGAISKIGIKHPVLFVLWGFLTWVSLSINIIEIVKKNKYKIFYYVSILLNLIFIVITVFNKFDYSIKNQYYLHCFGSLAFSITFSITVLTIFLSRFKNNVYYKIISLSTIILLVSDLVCLITFKETSLIEEMPIFFGIAILNIENFKVSNNVTQQIRKTK